MNDENEPRREDAAIARDNAAQGRDRAALKRDNVAKERESAAVSRHREIRQDIEDTQHLVSDTGEGVIFRVDGLQDKFFEHLIYATNAIEDATVALKAEKRTRKIQIGVLAAAVVLGTLLGVLTFLNTIHIEEQAEEADKIACMAINENRNTMSDVLEEVIFYMGDREEQRSLLERLQESYLLPLDCEGGIDLKNS